jgi:hypothetical protein
MPTHIGISRFAQGDCMSPADSRFWSALVAAAIFLGHSAAADQCDSPNDPEAAIIDCTRNVNSGKGKDAIWRLSTPIELPPITKRATSTAPSPTIMRRSGSIRNPPWPTLFAGVHFSLPARSKRRWPISTRQVRMHRKMPTWRCGSISSVGGTISRAGWRKPVPRST